MHGGDRGRCCGCSDAREAYTHCRSAGNGAHTKEWPLVRNAAHSPGSRAASRPCTVSNAGCSSWMLRPEMGTVTSRESGAVWA